MNCETYPLLWAILKHKTIQISSGSNNLYNKQFLKYRSTALAFKYYANLSLHKLQNDLKYSSLGFNLTKLSKIFIELLFFVQYTVFVIN